VKPTEHTAKSAVTPKTGRSARLRAAFRAQGRGAPARSLVAIRLIALCVVVGALALSAASARAEVPKLISYGKFPTGEYPFGIAVDNSGLASAGDVYVTSLAVSRINKFEETGKLLAPPSPFGGGSETYSGTAVNPTNGDLYVVDATSQAIETYDPSGGALLSSFSASGCANGFYGSYTWAQIATDSAGDVYLPCAPENLVRKYSPTGILLQTFAGSGTSALKEPTGVAVTPSGDVWVADTGDNRVEEFSSSGTVIGEIKSEGLHAIAVGASGAIFVLVKNSVDFCGSYAPPCYHLVEYGSGGEQLADIGAGTIGAPALEGFGAFNMLAIDGSNGHVYVTDAGNDVVWVYGPPVAPTVGRELVAEVGTSEAKLGALANPGGIPTTYRFEYGTTTTYGQATPFPEGSVGEGLTSRTVWASASGLAPGTTYHYRVTATNELGTVVGPDQTFTTATAAQATCPNEALRGGYSASLPDCRAYELVTPATAISSQPDSFRQREAEPAGLAARDGDSLAYPSTDILPGSDSGGKDYVATRGENGWSSENVTPRQSYTGDRCTTANTEVDAYSPDLSTAVLFAGGEQYAYQTGESTRGGGCGVEGLEVVSGEPLGVENLLLRNNTTAAYELINVPPAGVTPEDAHFDGAAADLSHVIFDEQAPLTPNAPDGADDLYEWMADSGLRLVTVLPNGTPVAGSLAASWSGHPHVISADGSHVFFTADGNLYVRLNGSSTVQIDASQAGGSGGGGIFQEANAEGSLVFFTDDASAALTSDTVPGSGRNLYLYDLANGQLTDLTPGGVGTGFEWDGLSEDGSSLYFTAQAVLARGATAGQPNIYLWHDGTTMLVAAAATDSCHETCLLAVSTDGLFFSFTTKQRLPTVNFPAGYDNTDASTGVLDNEVYLYDAATNELSCASCNPSGEPPTAGGAALEAGANGTPHALSDSGRLFFDTPEALVPRDTNGKMDVYEYEEGQLYLISSGTGSTESALVDASESGNDVFFITRQQLVPQDTHEELRAIYDARVDGGFPAVSSPPPCTTADACRAPVSPQPSVYGAPSSQTFSGAGNLAPPAAVKPKTKSRSKPAKCKRGSIKKRGKCVKKPKRQAKKSTHTDKAGK
jgi:streptogramin lyase